MLGLTYLERFRIKDKKAGLTEPSGLTLAEGGKALWTVSDDTGRIFRIGLDGALKRAASIDIPDGGLEGITTDPSGRFLYAVVEETNKVIKVDGKKRKVVAGRRLEDMAGYDPLAAYFAGSDENKGLEGIAWNAESGTLFTLKEGEPGLLIEIAADLSEIRAHRLLGPDNGFVEPSPEGRTVDFSGIDYDATRGLFWIVSDQARRVFLYDWAADRVVHSAALGYARKGRYREVEHAEGVAYDPQADRLYVVSDGEVRLYVFAVHA